MVVWCFASGGGGGGISGDGGGGGTSGDGGGGSVDGVGSCLGSVVCMYVCKYFACLGSPLRL